MEPNGSTTTIPLMPRIYAHPEVENGQTVFKIFVGDETAFLPEASRRGLSLGNLRDGSSNTVMVVETSSDNAVPWTQPSDINFGPNDPKAGLGHGLLDNFSISFFDGSVAKVSNTISDSDLAAIVTREGGEFPDNSGLQYVNEGTVTQPAFFGTAGDDTVNVSIGSATITAVGFERSTVHSIHGGRDFASFRDSDADDVFSGGSTYAFLNGRGFQITALNFANVIATSTGVVDHTRFAICRVRF